MNCPHSERNKSLYLFIRMAIKETVAVIKSTTYNYIKNFIHVSFKANYMCRYKYWGVGGISVNLAVTDQLLIIYSESVFHTIATHQTG
jgi:hypothetical protein